MSKRNNVDSGDKYFFKKSNFPLTNIPNITYNKGNDTYRGIIMTDTNRFRTLAKDEIVKLEAENYGRTITHEEIQIVFMSYVMGCMKATIVVAKNTQGRYYEVSYSSHNNRLYIDTYEKVADKVVEVK